MRRPPRPPRPGSILRRVIRRQAKQWPQCLGTAQRLFRSVSVAKALPPWSENLLPVEKAHERLSKSVPSSAQSSTPVDLQSDTYRYPAPLARENPSALTDARSASAYVARGDRSDSRPPAPCPRSGPQSAEYPAPRAGADRASVRLTRRRHGRSRVHSPRSASLPRGPGRPPHAGDPVGCAAVPTPTLSPRRSPCQRPATPLPRVPHSPRTLPTPSLRAALAPAWLNCPHPGATLRAPGRLNFLSLSL